MTDTRALVLISALIFSSASMADQGDGQKLAKARSECELHIDNSQQYAIGCAGDPSVCAWVNAVFLPGWEDCAKLPAPQPSDLWSDLVSMRKNQDRSALDDFLRGKKK